MSELLPDETVTWKQKWLEALRSDRYAQGTGTLRFNDNFCCLGVLCDVLDSENWERMPSGTYATKVHEGDNLLPAHIAKVAGLDRSKQWELANLNDRGKSFAEIADYIEEKL